MTFLILLLLRGRDARKPQGSGSFSRVCLSGGRATNAQLSLLVSRGNRYRQMRGCTCSVISNVRASLGGCRHFQSWTAAAPALTGALGEEFTGEKNLRMDSSQGDNYPAEEMRQKRVSGTVSVLIGEERQCFKEPAT